MAMFGRKPRKTPARSDGLDLPTALGQGHDVVAQLAAMHAENWGLGSAQRWDVDLAAGTITWTFADRTATAPVQVIGSYNSEAGEWAWGFALPSVPPPLQVAAESVRAFGWDVGYAALTDDRMPADDEVAGDLAAIAVRVSGATGFYRSPGNPSTHFTFGDVTITYDDDTSQVFSVDLE